MNQLHHPETLSAVKAYRQACMVANSSSRASNPDWYKPAHQVGLQWHIRTTGSPRLASAVYSESDQAWSDGPNLNLPQLRSMDALEAAIDEILKRHPKAKSLGIVLHIADEFATTEIFEDFSDWNQLDALSEQLSTNPHSLIGDEGMATEDTSWRIIPTPGAITPPICTTVAISHRYQEVLANLRALGEKRNFPIVTEGVSAPLAFLALLPAFLDFENEAPKLVVLHYHKFSALSIFSPNGELIKVRALPHRGRPHPPNLSDTLTAAVHANELQKPQIILVPMTSTDIEPLVTQLHATLHLDDDPVIDVIKPGVEPVTQCAGSRPEMLMALPDYTASEHSNTFKMLGGQGWAFQDFLAPPADESAAIPSWKEMQLLKLSKLAKPVFALVAIGALGLTMTGVISAISNESWQYDETTTSMLNGEINLLQQKQKAHAHWENILADRTSAWTTLELIARIFPKDSGVLVENVEYSARVEQAKKGNTLPFARSWTITGAATDVGEEHLTSLNSRDGISAVFTEITDATGIQSFDPSSDTRQLLINVTLGNNPQYNRSARVTRPLDLENCPTRFTMKIDLQYSAKDDLALTRGKQPK
ncbi:hypothetical protein [Sulfuriroseicoccus oceanibius]|uniref:Uncharacterized protein n=1 Tax=Sulfuriroseicoccus oceanibius TaxID=2707525 RepID=A0A6B3L2Q1_9BACT|nr:hypothetical protein [Sulfuriroseicoccus oceanibius]QQL44481.1 hypothetical protein G3M56_011405 [Sulfuriroseicoccus oceanibius]